MSIGDLVFQGCVNLKEIYMEDGITELELGLGLFYGCSVETIHLGRNLSYSSQYHAPFYNMKSLKSVKIGDCITSIKKDLFLECTELEEVHINDLNAWLKIEFSTKSSNPLFYANNLLLNSEIITELIIPDDIKDINKYAFCNCVNLKKIEISDGVINIGSSAFMGCCSVEKLYLGNTIANIEYNAFAECNNLLEVYANSNKAVECSKSVFSNDAYNNACLFVPTGRKFAYEKTIPWKFFYIVEMDYTSIDDIENIEYNNNIIYEYYDLHGRRVKYPTDPGIYVINGKKVRIY